MSQLYLSIPGCKLHIRNGRYIVTLRQETLLDVPCESINEVILLGGTQITTQAMRNLLMHHARIHLLTQEERHVGTLEPTESGRVETIRAQVRQTDQVSFRIQTAKMIINAKLENTRVVLLRLARDSKNPLISEAAQFQRLAKDSLQNAKSENEIRGFEGIAAQAYFAALSEIITTPWTFKQRKRRPAPDPVNAMLNFAYTLLLQHFQL